MLFIQATSFENLDLHKKYNFLSYLIREIEITSGGNDFDIDVATKAALQVKDILLKDEKLKASAKTNALNDFRFSYDDSVDDALLNGYEQSDDLYALLLNNDELKKKVMHAFIEDVYKKLST